MRPKLMAMIALACCVNVAQADILHLDDVIIDGSLCVGFDCVNGESFGFDTIRLKENNLRIHFNDTSNSASFPTQDWAIQINDTSNGGAEYFGVVDRDTARRVFTLEADAPSHSLYVDSGGRIGLGTSNPVVELHVVDGDTPTLRLEQDGSSGFTPQTWDVAGNETNFFVRDTTNGSQLPFKIRPGADTNALVLDPDGNIGNLAGTSPGASLHVRRTNGSAQIKVEETSGTAATRDLLRLENNGNVRVQMVNTAAGFGQNWQFINQGAAFAVSLDASGTTELRLQDDGDLLISGMLMEGSDVNSKTNFQPVDPQQVLAKVAALPIHRWQYKKDQGVEHIGPMAQDFHASFGLGEDDKHIGSLDTSGVALASIKALNEKLTQRDVLITKLNQTVGVLQQRIDELEGEQGRVAGLEASVARLLEQQAAAELVYTSVK